MNESLSCFKLQFDHGQGRSHAAVAHVCRLAETFSRMHKKQYLRDWGRGGVDATALLPNKRRWSSQREEKEGQMGDGRAGGRQITHHPFGADRRGGGGVGD